MGNSLKTTVEDDLKEIVARCDDLQCFDQCVLGGYVVGVIPRTTAKNVE